jgi:hypothetical protein
MTVTTIRAATRPRVARPLTRRIDRHGLRFEVLELTAVAAITAVAGAIPMTAIWLLGAIQTRRTIRRLHPWNDRRLRDAIDRTEVRASSV